MFGRGNSGNDGGNGGDHDDRALGPPMAVPDVPPLRIWDVVQRQNQWSERRVVEAHEMEMAPDGSVFRWRQFYKDERGLPHNFIVLTVFRPIDGWLEYSERKPEPVPQLVVPPGAGSRNVTLM